MKDSSKLVEIEDKAYKTLQAEIAKLVASYKESLQGLADPIQIAAFAVDALSCIAGAQYVDLAKEELKEAGLADLNDVEPLVSTARMVAQTAGASAMNEFLHQLKDQSLVTEKTLVELQATFEKQASGISEAFEELSRAVGLDKDPTKKAVDEFESSTKPTKKETYH